MIHNFKTNYYMGETYGVPYNGFSVMQYESWSFSNNGKNTMESKVYTIHYTGTPELIFVRPDL